MNILFTGKTDFKYNRVRVLVAGLQKLKDVNLTIFPIESRRSFDKRKFAELQEKADVVYIPPFRHRDVTFIRKQTKKPIVFDPLISKYLTKDDFGHFWKLPFKYFLDKIPFSACDVLLSDTNCHKEYFSRQFRIPLTKIHVLPIGVDTDSFYQNNERITKSTDGIFKVGFYGSFVPLQGTDKIMMTAHELAAHQDIKFEIIGGGYRLPQAKRLVKKWNLINVNFQGVLKYDQLNEQINQFDICLGIFGDSDKANFVIPNKIYHYASVGKCVLTKESAGIREIFTDNENIVLCSSDPVMIAKAIIELKNDRERVRRIGQASYKLITEEYNEIQIAKRFLEIIQAAGIKASNGV